MKTEYDIRITFDPMMEKSAWDYRGYSTDISLKIEVVGFFTIDDAVFRLKCPQTYKEKEDLRYFSSKCEFEEKPSLEIDEKDLKRHIGLEYFYLEAVEHLGPMPNFGIADELYLAILLKIFEECKERFPDFYCMIIPSALKTYYKVISRNAEEIDGLSAELREVMRVENNEDRDRDKNED